MLIPGGRDIPPDIYGQENKGSRASTPFRYNYMSDVMKKMNKKMPIFGVCWGFQFLNIYYGGDLIQHIENSDEHYKKRRFTVLKDSILYEAVGDEIIGNCYHHQNIGRLGKNVKVTAFDDFSKTPHAIDIVDEERFIFAVLWHPESTKEDESGLKLIDKSVKLSKFFINKCAEYKKQKK